MNINNTFELLATKEIYAILDGDTQFEEYIFQDDNTKIEISMPYLSGPDLCEISTKLGLPKIYSWGGGCSRWQYVEELLLFCINNNKCSEFLSLIFSKRQFYKKLNGHTNEQIDIAYQYFVRYIIRKINNILYFSSHELKIVNNKFIVSKIGEQVAIQAPKIQTINREYVKNISNRSIEDINNGDFDSAITKSRTLIEEVFCYVIELKNISPEMNGNIQHLYKQVKELYNMHFDRGTDIRVKKLLSGLETIISSISEMRNHNSDAHGVGSSRIEIKDYHTRLFVNSSIAVADFILSVANNATQKPIG